MHSDGSYISFFFWRYSIAFVKLYEEVKITKFFSQPTVLDNDLVNESKILLLKAFRVVLD